MKLKLEDPIESMKALQVQSSGGASLCAASPGSPKSIFEPLTRMPQLRTPKQEHAFQKSRIKRNSDDTSGETSLPAVKGKSDGASAGLHRDGGVAVAR